MTSAGSMNVPERRIPVPASGSVYAVPASRTAGGSVHVPAGSANVLSLDGVVQQRTYAQSYYTSGPTDSFAPEASPMLNRDGSRLSVSSNPSTSSAAGSLGVPLRE